jgi:hypothetical protein
MSVERSPAPGVVQVVSAHAFAAMKVNVPHDFALRFPEWWWPTPLRHPEAEAIERDTLAWLRSFGIGLEAGEAEKLRKFDCAKYGGYSLPMSDRASAMLVTQFISLWLFWDDMQVEEESGWDVEEVVRALVEATPPVTASRYVAAWADIGRRLRAERSDAWLERLGAAMRQWLVNAKVETGLAKAWKRGQCPEFDTAFATRTVSIGMYPHSTSSSTPWAWSYPRVCTRTRWWWSSSVWPRAWWEWATTLGGWPRTSTSAGSTSCSCCTSARGCRCPRPSPAW